MTKLDSIQAQAKGYDAKRKAFQALQIVALVSLFCSPMFIF